MEIKFSDDNIINDDINNIPLDKLLTNLGIDTLMVIVKRNGAIILENELLNNDDSIQIIQIIHGG